MRWGAGSWFPGLREEEVRLLELQGAASEVNGSILNPERGGW